MMKSFTGAKVMIFCDMASDDEGKNLGEFYKFILSVFEVCFEQIAVRKEGDDDIKNHSNIIG